MGGWALYVKSGKLKYCYNFFGIEHFFAESDQPIPTGKHQVRMEFKYDGGGIAKGGDVTLSCDGNAVGKGRIDKTIPMGYSADEACDVGRDTGSPIHRITARPRTPSMARSPGSGFASAMTTTTT